MQCNPAPNRCVIAMELVQDCKDAPMYGFLCRNFTEIKLDDVAKLHHRVDMTRKQRGLLKFLESATGRAMSRMATDIGMVPSTLTRQFKAGTVPVVEIVKICREYGVDLLEAFVAAEFITQAEADSLSSKGALSGATDAELTGEILRRLESGSATTALTDPIGADVDPKLRATSTVTVAESQELLRPRVSEEFRRQLH